MQKNVSRWSQALWISILQWVAQQRVYQATFLHHHWEWILRGKYPWVSECPSPELRLCRGLIREQKTLQALENHIIWENCSRGFAWEECSCVIYKDRWTVRKRNRCPRSTIADEKDLFSSCCQKQSVESIRGRMNGHCVRDENTWYVTILNPIGSFPPRRSDDRANCHVHLQWKFHHSESDIMACTWKCAFRVDGENGCCMYIDILLIWVLIDIELGFI